MDTNLTEGTDADFDAIELAYEENQFLPRLRTIMRNTDLLFVNATPEQRAAYVAARTRARAETVEMLVAGSAEATVIGHWRKFFQTAGQMPRLAPPAPTPKSEVARFAADMTNIRHPVRYRMVELEALEVALGRGWTENESLVTYDMRSITSSKRVIARRDLPQVAMPGSMTRTDRWMSMFPNPKDYESPDRPRVEPPQVVRE